MTTMDATVRASELGLSAKRIGIAGIAFGVIAFWIALPPVTTR